MPKAQVLEVPPYSTIKGVPAPYLPFLTFQSSVTQLEHGIPKKLDRTMWPSQSGLVQSQILMAFRFFDLVDDEDRPTALLHELVEAKDDNRAGAITKLLNVAYSSLIEHDLTKMTPKMLEDEMEQYRVTGETKRKAVTFFLRAAKFVGMPMHPLLSSMVRNTSLRGKRKGNGKKGTFIGDISGRADTGNTPPSGGNTKTVRLSNGGTVSLSISADPFTLPAEDRQFVFELVDKLQGYAQAHADDSDDESEPEEEA